MLLLLLLLPGVARAASRGLLLVRLFRCCSNARSRFCKAPCNLKRARSKATCASWALVMLMLFGVAIASLVWSVAIGFGVPVSSVVCDCIAMVAVAGVLAGVGDGDLVALGVDGTESCCF